MKKRLLRLCSIVLAIGMVWGNVVSVSADTESTGTTGMIESGVRTLEDANQKLLFNTQQMSRSTRWPFAKEDCDFACATYASQVILTSGYTNIISYCAPSDGFIRITDMKVGFYGSSLTDMVDSGVTREFEFAVTNENGKILSNRGDILLFNSDRTVENDLSVEEYEIKKGENIYFVFHGNTGSTNIIQCTPNIEFRVDSSDEWEGVSSLRSMVPWPKDNTTWNNDTAVQGMDGFYYYYSESYEKAADTENSDKLILNTKPMTNSEKDWPFISPDSSKCKTNIPQIIVDAGTTNVISYQAEADGYIWIDEMQVWQVNAATGYQVDFAVVDETGKVLTNNGKVYDVSYSPNSDAKANVENLVMTKQEIKKGERIYFVFRGIEGVTSVRCSADIQFCKVGDVVGSQVNMGLDYNEGMTLRKSGVNNTNIAQGTGDGDFFYEYSSVYEEVENKKPEFLHITPADMGEYSAHASFPFEQPDCGIRCMTRSGEIITSAGYTNVISYQVPEDGELYIETMKVWIANHAEGLKSEFAVIDEDGKILTNNGKLYSMESVYIDGDQPRAYAKAISDAKNLVVTKRNVKAGERIYFVFHGIVGNTQSLRCNAQIMFRAADEDTWKKVNDQYNNAEMTLYSKNNWVDSNSTVEPTQGIDNFYYQYSTQNTTDVDGVKIGSDTEGWLTIYEKAESGKYYSDKYVVEADSVGNVTSYIDLDMLNIKKQSKVNADNADKTDVRFIAAVDNLSYQKVGFLFTKDEAIAQDAEQFTVETIPEKANRSTTKVYTKMLEYGTYRKASNIYADDGCNTAYGFAFEMKKIPANDGTIYVRAYVLLEDGETYVYGEPRAINVTAAGTVN